MAAFPPAQPAVIKSLTCTLTWRTLRWRRHHMCGRRGSSAPVTGRWPPHRSWSTSLWRTAAKRWRRSLSRHGEKIQEVRGYSATANYGVIYYNNLLSEHLPSTVMLLSSFYHLSKFVVKTVCLWIYLHVSATYFTRINAKYLRHSCYSLSHFEGLFQQSFTNMHMNGYTGQTPPVPKPLTRTPATTEATAFLRSPQSMHSHSGQRKLSRKPAMGALLPAHLLLCAGEPRIDTGSGVGPHTLQAATCEPIIRLCVSTCSTERVPDVWITGYWHGSSLTLSHMDISEQFHQNIRSSPPTFICSAFWPLISSFKFHHSKSYD